MPIRNPLNPVWISLTRPVVAGCGRIAFIGDKKHYLEHRVDSFAQFRYMRYFALDFGFAEHSLGAYDALRGRTVRRKESAFS